MVLWTMRDALVPARCIPLIGDLLLWGFGGELGFDEASVVNVTPFFEHEDSCTCALLLDASFRS